jgi:hypothetical protein
METLMQAQNKTVEEREALRERLEKEAEAKSMILDKLKAMQVGAC